MYIPSSDYAVIVLNLCMGSLYILPIVIEMGKAQGPFIQKCLGGRLYTVILAFSQ